MKILSDPIQTQAQSKKWRLQKRASIGFVPTMGALHEGHLELVRASRKKNTHTVVSIYVNPLQFGPKEDLTKYPRTLKKDLALLKKEKVDLVFTPSDKEMYPAGFSTEVRLKGSLAQGLCAPFRPGHFEGVATVVLKLLNSVQPDRLYLGQKDAQQAVILSKLIQDLNLPVEPVICPIVRESDGLAMSSRNLRLSLAAREVAPVLYQALKVGKDSVDLGLGDPGKVLKIVAKIISANPQVRLQYLEVVDSKTLLKVQKIKPGTLLALAAFLDNVRLIDNIVL